MRLTLLLDVICYFNRHVRSSSSRHGFIYVLIEIPCDIKWIFLVFLMNCLKKEKEIRRQKRSITWLSVCKYIFHFLQSNKNGSFCKIRNYICVQISYISKIRQTPQTLSLITMKLTITFSHLADTFMHLHLCLYSWSNPTDVMCFVSNYASLCGISCTFLFHH